MIWHFKPNKNIYIQESPITGDHTAILTMYGKTTTYPNLQMAKEAVPGHKWWKRRWRKSGGIEQWHVCEMCNETLSREALCDRCKNNIK